jgi:spore coat polysaccharide biosynthesis protein SpsF (cytidylyltransferase family)
VLLPEIVEDREHVTPLFYQNAERYRIESFRYRRNVAHVQLSVDTQDDLERVRSLVTQFRRPHWTYGVDDLLGMLENEA